MTDRTCQTFLECIITRERRDWSIRTSSENLSYDPNCTMRRAQKITAARYPISQTDEAKYNLAGLAQHVDSCGISRYRQAVT